MGNVAVGVAVLELILRFGLPVALKLIQDMNIDNPTSEDIRGLLTRVPHPNAYEEEDGL